ncbi:MAG: hypothetical protein HY899_10670 [Deltaproteobacteria bacterium]|nr:hypothetical protein [Deltaproteobacteria bacterium]
MIDPLTLRTTRRSRTSKAPVRGVRADAATLALLSLLCVVCIPLYASAEPPPQAPAHGFRAKAADGTDVVFDRVFGAYAVPRQIRTYWSGDRFYRYIDGLWLSASALTGPWEMSASAVVPASLRAAFPPPRERVRTKLPSGLAVIYEPSIRVFSVVGQPDLYVHDGRFLRYLNGVWLVAARQDGPWELAPMKGLPTLLLRKVAPPEPGARVSLPSGLVLEYDGALAMFRVAGKPDTYFHNCAFFERRAATWFRSARADADFEEISLAKVPPALRASYRDKDAAGSASKGARQAGSKAAKQGKDARVKAAGAGKKAASNPAATDAKPTHKVPKPAHDKQDAAEGQ